MSKSTDQRASFFFATKPKCGSQWVRNVLTDPGVFEAAAMKNIVSTDEIKDQGLHHLKPATFYGPSYAVPPTDWQRLAGKSDRLVFVKRDPRDIIFSWIYSLTYSHPDRTQHKARRASLREASPKERLNMACQAAANFARGMVEYEESKDPKIYVTSYEALMKDSLGEFNRIIEFAGWPVQKQTLAHSVKINSFEAQSGRRPGEQNIFSHFRKGVPGDWKNHLSRAAAKEFEALIPGILRRLGYAASDDWWRELAEVQEFDVIAEEIVDRDKFYELRRTNTRLLEEQRHLKSALGSQDQEIAQLKDWVQQLETEGATNEALIDTLHEKLQSADERNKELEQDLRVTRAEMNRLRSFTNLAKDKLKRLLG